MKVVLIAILALMLTACSSFGNMVASVYDSGDLCQSYGKPANYQMPGYCGAARGNVTVVTRDYTSGRYLTTTTYKP